MEEKMGSVNEIINSINNNTLITAFPFFKSPPNSNYASLYPKLTEYLKTKIPQLKYNSFIISKLEQYSELTEQQIINDISWNNGPTIEIVQLDSFCQVCNANTYGLFQSSNPSVLYIDVDLVLALENSQPGPQGNTLAFLLGVTLLHEYVHLGDNTDGIDQPGEEGLQFEETTYGESVWLDNAGNILIKWQQ